MSTVNAREIPGLDKMLLDFEHIWALRIVRERRNELKAFRPSTGADRRFACMWQRTEMETKMSACALYLLLIHLSGVACLLTANIDSPPPPTKHPSHHHNNTTHTECWAFKRLSLPICCLIFQREVFQDSVAPGCATGSGSLVTCMKNNLCVVQGFW